MVMKEVKQLKFSSSLKYGEYNVLGLSCIFILQMLIIFKSLHNGTLTLARACKCCHHTHNSNKVSKW